MSFLILLYYLKFLRSQRIAFHEMHPNVQLNHRTILSEEACHEASGQMGRELRERQWLSCWISRNDQQVGGLMEGTSGMLLHILSQSLTTLLYFWIPYIFFSIKKRVILLFEKKNLR